MLHEAHSLRPYKISNTTMRAIITKQQPFSDSSVESPLKNPITPTLPSIKSIKKDDEIKIALKDGELTSKVIKVGE